MPPNSFSYKMLFSLITLLYCLFILILTKFNNLTCHWSFGYGSNMDITHMTLRKELNILSK